MNRMRSAWKSVMGSNDANNQNGFPVDEAVDVLEPVEDRCAVKNKSVTDKKKGWFGKTQTSSGATETQEEFYARMDREEKEREADSRRKKLEEERKSEEDRRQREQKRLLEEEARRREESAREAEREREALRAKEDLERQLKMQREEHERMLAAQRQKAEIEAERSREDREHQERLRHLDEESRQRDQRARDDEMERKNEALRLQGMQQLQRNNQDATAALSSAVAMAAADSAFAANKMLQEMTAENEAQCQLRMRTAQLQKELNAATIREHDMTEMFIKGVDESMKAAIQELDRKKERDLEAKNRREKEAEESRSRYQEDFRAKNELEEKEQMEKHKQYLESQERIRREQEADAARYHQDLDRMRDAHAVRVDDILAEERARMEEINRMRIEKEEERKDQWERMRNAFVEMMRARYAEMTNNDMEKKWDDRFNELRRAFDPVQEAYSDLESIPLCTTNLAKSLIPFECYLDSLRMALSTLEDIMASEHEQVAEWKEQQPDAHFLPDLESVLETILTAIGRVRREINMVVNDIAMNRDSPAELERVFELRYLGERIKLLSEEVDGIPTVYDLNKKYANVTGRSETTL